MIKVENHIRKNFFKDEKERLLWVRLNAEHIQYTSKIINHKDEPLGDINIPHSCMQISLFQLEYDEHNCDAPRLSFEELVLPHDELMRIMLKKEREHTNEMFENKFGNEFDDHFDINDIL